MRIYYEDGAGGFFAIDPNAIRGMGDAVLYKRGATTPGDIGAVQDSAVAPDDIKNHTPVELVNVPEAWVLAIGLDKPRQPAQLRQPAQPRQPAQSCRQPRPQCQRAMRPMRASYAPEVNDSDRPRHSFFEYFIAVMAIGVWTWELIE